jgi:hypothetical protein
MVMMKVIKKTQSVRNKVIFTVTRNRKWKEIEKRDGWMTFLCSFVE